MGWHHTLHHLRHRPDGRRPRHYRQGLRPAARARVRAVCLAHHQLGTGALGGTMTRPATKALNKPLLIVGLDRKLASLAFILSVIVGANDGGSKIAAVVLFLA